MKVTLVHHPTVALKVSGFQAPEFEAFSATGIYLGNIYRRIIPPSLPRVASVLERELAADVRILDLRIADWRREEIYKSLMWEGYRVDAYRVGAPFAAADAAIQESDWLGLSSHFTFESGVVADLIAYARRLKPSIKIMVGGADVTARPHDYLSFGADLVFVGDLNPDVLRHDLRGPTLSAPFRYHFEGLITPAFDKLLHLHEYSDSHDGPVPEGVPFPIGFIYFTRGCPRECNFCESRRTRFEPLDYDLALRMVEHYRRAGIRTLNFADDNLLLLAARPAGRESLLELMKTLKRMGFAWEFPNGLEVGMLLRQDGSLDEPLMDALFSNEVDRISGNLVGGYRLYLPVETFDRRADFKKLKPLQDQNRIIEYLARSQLRELDFGVVLPPDADENTFENTRLGYLGIQEILRQHGKVRARYALFHLIPIALFRSMQTKYSVREFPEGWNFHIPVYDGTRFPARELFERRLRLLKEIDPHNFLNMVKGQYTYS